jgi:hypothetical protein
MEGNLVLAAILGLSLVSNASFDPHLTGPAGVPGNHAVVMTPHQKDAVMRPLIRSATACVARAVASNPQFRRGQDVAEVNELIVSSMAACTDAVRAMISAHDRLFGEGSGEAFFMGPYLDVLPASVIKLVRDHSR